MFLRNYDNYWVELNSAQSSYLTTAGSSTTQQGDGHFNQKTTAGTLTTIRYGGYYYNSSSRSVSGYFPVFALSPKTICLGDGTQPVTYDDYKLSGQTINLTLNQKSAASTYDNNKGVFQRVLVCTCSNLTDSDITISEWGVWKANQDYLYYSTATYSNSSASFVLMFREVLETPITIKAGTTSTLTFKVDIPMPNHP